MPEYKLVYFNARGRAELTRWIFAYSGIPYEDERVEKDDWPQRKANITGGKLPVLMVDGRTLPQSLAIARYVAKQAGLVPRDDLEAAFCDELADTIYDLLPHWRKFLTSGKNEDEKRKEFDEEFLPTFLEPLMNRLNKQLENEWFIPDKITWSDLLIGVFFGVVKKVSDKLQERFPALMAHVTKVENLPNIKEWIAVRPDTVL